MFSSDALFGSLHERRVLRLPLWKRGDAKLSRGIWNERNGFLLLSAGDGALRQQVSSAILSAPFVELARLHAEFNRGAMAAEGAFANLELRYFDALLGRIGVDL